MTVVHEMKAAAAAFVADPTAENEAAVRETSRAYGLAARLVDERVAGLRARAAGARRADPCVRCGGSGQYLDLGVCFRCDGRGEEPES